MFTNYVGFLKKACVVLGLDTSAFVSALLAMAKVAVSKRCPGIYSRARTYPWRRCTLYWTGGKPWRTC